MQRRRVGEQRDAALARPRRDDQRRVRRPDHRQRVAELVPGAELVRAHLLDVGRLDHREQRRRARSRRRAPTAARGRSPRRASRSRPRRPRPAARRSAPSRRSPVASVGLHHVRVEHDQRRVGRRRRRRSPTSAAAGPDGRPAGAPTRTPRAPAGTSRTTTSAAPRAPARRRSSTSSSTTKAASAAITIRPIAHARSSSLHDLPPARTRLLDVRILGGAAAVDDVVERQRERVEVLRAQLPAHLAGGDRRAVVRSRRGRRAAEARRGTAAAAPSRTRRRPRPRRRAARACAGRRAALDRCLRGLRGVDAPRQRRAGRAPTRGRR